MIERRGTFLRTWRHAAVTAILAIAAGPQSSAMAAGWEPTEPVEIMVHSKPGSGPDVLARFVQKIMQEHKLVSVPVTINNQPVVSVGYAWLDQHKGNAHKLTVSSTITVAAPLMGTSEVPWADLTPISLLMSDYIALAVPADSEIKTAKDFLEKLKADPGSLSIGFGGSRGNPNHTALVQAAQEVGVDPASLKVVVYSSGSEARTAAIGGHIDGVTNSVGPFLGAMQEGQLRLIAIASPERLAEPFHEVPTWREQGYDVVDSNWRWFGAAGGLTEEQIAYWENVAARLVETDDWKQMVKTNMSEPTYLNREDTLAFFEEQDKVMRTVLDSLGLLQN